MKVSIEVESQSEFEIKRSELISRLAGNRYDIDLEKSLAPVSSGIKAQDDMVEYFCNEFDNVIRLIKNDVSEALK
jgi:hypothetical protein